MILLVLFSTLFVCELLYFRLADRWRVVDKPNVRSSHSTETVRGGGIVFPLAGSLGFFLYGYGSHLFLAGLVLIAAVSFLDDVRPLPNKIRLGVHLLALLFLFAQWNLFQQYPLLVLPALIFCAGIINAWNFMDGINGITGGYSLVVLTGLAFVNHFRSPFVDPNIITVFIVSLLVFNFFNFRTKARCFAGDVGSISMAFVVVYLLGSLILATGDLAAICFVAVYGVDSVLTIIHRLLLKENIFQAHRKHLYQLLANERKVPHLWVSLLYMGIQAGIIVGYFFLVNQGTLVIGTYVCFVCAALAMVYAAVKSKWHHLQKFPHKYEIS